ncbi:S-DNA-T family DNA segregation ATPase FtsK/SpoIIIE [Ancylobacter sp. 3268]|uniref:DNA translocase FtsK n=1 Tax=Ancylobacter sp. 3268 TaxID=2817752 RepID=UPI00285E6DAC|nr:DNA translocase FtsK [Ancylobacter sp. 3268]MDR6953143.1 S-DNA-T family DNA segregation ATPase FtsK/SpoIIIE [Ancylobacter sp. 3268]
MRFPDRPSDRNGSPSTGTSDDAARAARLVSRANHKLNAPPPPQVKNPAGGPGSTLPAPSLYASAPLAEPPGRPAARAISAGYPATGMPRGPAVPRDPAPLREPAYAGNPTPAVAPGPRVVIPSWLQPFTMPPNTRFTRTPDYLLRQPPAAEPVLPPPATTAPTAAPVDAAASTAARPPALVVPPRKPPASPILQPATPNSALPAAPVTAAPEPVAAALGDAAPVVAEPSVPTPVVTATFTPQAGQPDSIQRIAGLIQLGWAEPPVVPAHQDMAIDAPMLPPIHDDGIVQNGQPLAFQEEEALAAEETDGDLDSIEEMLADSDEDEHEAEAGWDEEDVAEEDPAEEEDDLDDEAMQQLAVDEPAFPISAETVIVESTPVEELLVAVAAEPDLTAAFDAPYALGGAAVTFSWPAFAIAASAPAPAAERPTPLAAPQPAPAPERRATPAARPAPVPAALPVRAGYELPPLELLTEPPEVEPDYELSEEFLERNSVKLQQVLHDFGVRGEIIDANPGPVVTLYELEPAPGIKSSRVIGLSADISRSMSAISARVAVVEGRNVIGIELPNQRRETVWLREMLSSHEFEAAKAKLGIGLGKTIGGEPVIVDLAKMPHLLVAGTTGSGKSVAINTMILSLLYRHRPDQCRLIMIDPKMLELSVYEGIPHLLTPVVTDPKKAIVALKWAVREMEERYKKMSRLGVRNIDGFNARVAEAAAKGEIITRTIQKGFDRETGEMIEEEEIMDLSPLPYIVIVVDEMADLMMVAGKDIEGAIQRLAQMARAAGIHLIMATQRPSVDVITGTIKANFPTRISFQVTSKIDSRTILGEMGAEQLLGQGDMLYMAGGGRISRVHGPFVSDQEVERVVEHLKAQGRPDYLDEVTAEDDEDAAPPAGDVAVFDASAMGSDTGDLYDQAVAVVMRDRKASTSYIQRRLQIGYNRAASIMERMENEGLVGPANHAGKREIISDARSGH